MTSQTHNTPTSSLSADPTVPLFVEHRDDVRWLHLNRPARRNAINAELLTALDQAVRDATNDPETTVIVIAGRGPSFCAGADLHYLHMMADAGEDPLDFLSEISGCFTRIEQAPQPVVAVVHGHVVAGGLELALACDVVLAQSGTLVGDGHIRNGLMPAGGASVRLPRKVGEPLARWLMLTGELLPAEVFTGTGFIHAVAPAERFDHMVTDSIDRLRRTAGITQLHLKQLLHAIRDLPPDRALAQELAAFADHWNSADIATALHRFLSGQRPTSPT